MTDPDAPLDEIDLAILDQVRSLHSVLDPPPAGLDERIAFAIALETVDLEVARLQEDLLVGSGARGTERIRTMTFDAESLTIMIAIAELPDGLLRLDGWLAPAAAMRVELRVAADTGPARVAFADESGRFVFHGVGHGLAQLLVRRGSGGSTASIVTPSLML